MNNQNVPLINQQAQGQYAQYQQLSNNQQQQPMYPNMNYGQTQGMPGQPLQGQPIYQQGPPMYQQNPQMYQAQPIQAQPMYIAPNQGFPCVDNPLQELCMANSAIIKQEAELLEMVTGCETPNRYHVYIIDRSGNHKYLFKCKEQSSCCSRNCCPANGRPFSMRVKHVTSRSGITDDFRDDSLYAQFDRPFKCTCCCLGRPSMTGIYKESGVYFGKVMEPCTVCSPIFNVHDKDNTIKWRISCDCCQCGFCCRNNTFGKLSSVKFDILEGTTEKIVGTIKKKCEGMIELFSDADTFVMDFPNSATPEEKLMLIGSVLMIDFRYYENSGGDNKGIRNQQHHH